MYLVVVNIFFITVLKIKKILFPLGFFLSLTLSLSLLTLTLHSSSSSFIHCNFISLTSYFSHSLSSFSCAPLYILHISLFFSYIRYISLPQSFLFLFSPYFSHSLSSPLCLSLSLSVHIFLFLSLTLILHLNCKGRVHISFFFLLRNKLQLVTYCIWFWKMIGNK